MKTVKRFVLLEDRIEDTTARPSWAVLDRQGFPCGLYEWGDAIAAVEALNGPLGYPEHQPYSVSFVGTDRRDGNDRRTAA